MLSLITKFLQCKLCHKLPASAPRKWGWYIALLIFFISPISVKAQTWPISVAVLNVVGNRIVPINVNVSEQQPYTIPGGVITSTSPYMVSQIYDETFVIRCSYSTVPQQPYVTVVGGPDLRLSIALGSISFGDYGISPAADQQLTDVTIMSAYMVGADGNTYDMVCDYLGATYDSSKSSFTMRFVPGFTNVVLPVSPYSYRIGDIYLRVRFSLIYTFNHNSAGNSDHILRPNVSFATVTGITAAPQDFEALSDYVVNGSPIETDIRDQIKAGNDQDAAWRNEDKSNADKTGGDLTGIAQQLSGVKSKWAILWYPFEFTKAIFDVISGGTSSATYSLAYGNVCGYRYDDTDGMLYPVYDFSRSRADPGGTIISFPAFDLPGFGRIWDGYDYDLSRAKYQVPVVFDAIYVISLVLEVFWFVGFLRDKYEEVFG